jgi:hypothetical protein
MSGADSPNMWKARIQVDRLLNAASDLKMLRHHTQEAREKIEAAYQLAEKNDLPQPWPSLCAYRLGHLIMRTAISKESLLDAEQYFMEASRAGSLRPLPSLYRLAVLHRLEKMKAGVTEVTIKKAFAKAEKDIQKGGVDNKAQIQDHLFNVLEMTSYFSGMDYGEIEGMGDYHESKKSPPSWILAGPVPRIAEVKYSEAYALEELEGLMKSHANAVFFVLRNLNSPKTGDDPRAKWKNGEQEWKKASYPGLRLLALLLRQTSRSLNGLMFQFIGGSDFQFDAFNQNKVRLKRHLAELTDRKIGDILLESAQGIPKINPHMKIFGAIEESALYI